MNHIPDEHSEPKTADKQDEARKVIDPRGPPGGTSVIDHTHPNVGDTPEMARRVPEGAPPADTRPAVTAPPSTQTSSEAV
jgi:hypothetical protein